MIRVDIPGQPPSRNHSYRIIRIKHRDGTSHQQLGKVPGVEDYQLVVTALVRQATRGIRLADQIRLRYWFYVKRDVDCDNAMKALNDAIAIGLGVDDKRFLPCAVEKHTKTKEPHVVVEIAEIDDP